VSWATGLMVYLVIWWTMLFTVLPLGVRRVENPGRGQDRGAPETPQLLRKVIITSIVAAVLWLGFYFVHQADIFDFRKWADHF
jgi:predicted secreted protein